eukprot:762513-Hanusia_phi.AAC.4
MVCGKSVQSMLDDIPARSSELRQALPPGVLRGAWDGAMAAGAPPVNVPAPPLPGSNVADAERRRAMTQKTKMGLRARRKAEQSQVKNHGA